MTCFSCPKNNLRTGVPKFLFTFLFLFLTPFSFAAEPLPQELRDVGVEEHLGSNINLGLNFQDESGTTVSLKRYFNGTKPVLFFLVYYECPNLCTLVINGAIDAMKRISLQPGKDFEVVAVSIDPREDSNLAKNKKAAYLKLYGKPDTASGWHFLVGKQPAISELSQQLGFKYKWDEDQKQFAHASTLFVLTGNGKISRYFYGIMYPERDMRLALLEAGEGHIGSLVDKFLLFCFHDDASTKKYVLMASRIMTVGGGLTVLILACYFTLAIRRSAKRRSTENDLAHANRIL